MQVVVVVLEERKSSSQSLNMQLANTHIWKHSKTYRCRRGCCGCCRRGRLGSSLEWKIVRVWRWKNEDRDWLSRIQLTVVVVAASANASAAAEQSEGGFAMSQTHAFDTWPAYAPAQHASWVE